MRIGNFNIFKLQQLLGVDGVSANIKGRAADLRWVKARYIVRGRIGFHLLSNDLSISSNNIDYFVTKWGSTSIRVQLSYFKFYLK